MSVVSKSAEYLDFYAPEGIVSENVFIHRAPDRSFPPSLAEVKKKLPRPFWDGHAVHIACYWKAWDLAFKNLRRVHVGNRFIAPYIDTAFNDCLFMWDSCFILMFGRYGARAFNFQATLDNLYAKQHTDGFISREITQWSGQDRFHRFDPVSTGPNILAWSEWEYFCNFNDMTRLSQVFPVLLGYHLWCRRHRTWPDGSYFSCGLACGMDNQPRVLPGCSAWSDHSYMAWIDATSQALLSARLLVAMAKVLGQETRPEAQSCVAEVATLQRIIRECMWDKDRDAFADRMLRDASGGVSFSHVRTVGAYWTLLAGAPLPHQLDPFVAHLDDPALFNRPVRVPALAKDHPDYHPKGGYWNGGVWAPTNYMVLRGLTQVGKDDLAADIGRNYHENIVKQFEDTGTLWENIAPELEARPIVSSGAGVASISVEPRPIPGEPSKADFVGWSGVGPIAVLFEYVFGLRADVPSGTLVWDVRLLERFGVKGYPWGVDGSIDVDCKARSSYDEEPVVTVTANCSLKLVLKWGGQAHAEGGVRSTTAAGAATTHSKEWHIMSV